MSEHEPWCRFKVEGHSDAAKRLCDTYNLHRMVDLHGSIGKWFAAALQDSDSDGVLYDSKLEAVRHQKHNEQYYAFIKICPNSMNVCEAEVMVMTNRNLYKNGMRMSDPDHKHGGPSVIKRLMVEEELANLGRSIRDLKLPL